MNKYRMRNEIRPSEPRYIADKVTFWGVIILGSIALLWALISMFLVK